MTETEPDTLIFRSDMSFRERLADRISGGALYITRCALRQTQLESKHWRQIALRRAPPHTLETDLADAFRKYSPTARKDIGAGARTTPPAAPDPAPRRKRCYRLNPPGIAAATIALGTIAMWIWIARWSLS